MEVIKRVGLFLLTLLHLFGRIIMPRARKIALSLAVLAIIYIILALDLQGRFNEIICLSGLDSRI
jgi:hypothetical protein